MASVLRPAVRLRQTRPVWSGSKPLSQLASRVSTSDILRPSSVFARTTSYSVPQREPSRRTSFNSPIPASFHTSAQRSILPPGPQVIEGTANDPAPVPEPSPTHGSYHWVFERTMSAALIPLTIAPFAAGTLNPITDALLCAGIIIHSHIGFQSIIIDYVPDKRLPRIRALFWWGLRLATLVVAVGFFEFETSDVGLTEAIQKIWTAKRKEEANVEPVLGA